VEHFVGQDRGDVRAGFRLGADEDVEHKRGDDCVGHDVAAGDGEGDAVPFAGGGLPGGPRQNGDVDHGCLDGEEREVLAGREHAGGDLVRDLPYECDGDGGGYGDVERGGKSSTEHSVHSRQRLLGAHALLTPKRGDSVQGTFSHGVRAQPVHDLHRATPH